MVADVLAHSSDSLIGIGRDPSGLMQADIAMCELRTMGREQEGQQTMSVELSPMTPALSNTQCCGR